jgi:hypothetical protein
MIYRGPSFLAVVAAPRPPLSPSPVRKLSLDELTDGRGGVGEEPNLTTAEKAKPIIKDSIFPACMYCRPMWGVVKEEVLRDMCLW